MNPPPFFIARPSGVWNTRSPLNNFVAESNKVTIDYSVLTLAISRTRYLITHRDSNDKKTSVKKYLATNSAGHVAGKAWDRYRGAKRVLTGQYEGQPSFTDLNKDLATSIYAVRENSIARYSSKFETFIQSWALNMLLAHAESGKDMPDELKKLTYDFSPFRQRFIIPTVPIIFDSFKTINSELEKLPHISTDPKTGEQVSEPISTGLNAKSVILFWRDFRNSIVHQDGLVTYAFYEKYNKLFETLRLPYAEILRPLEPGTRLQLPDIVFSAITTTHSKTAFWLNECLQAISETRGQIQLDEANSQFSLSNSFMPLLVEGDHPISLRWIKDATWRNELLIQFPRKWHTVSNSLNA